MKQDIHSEVTAAIVAQLEQGVRPWAPRWTAADITRPLRACGTPYQGINVLTLWARAHVDGFSSATWLTFKQALELGGAVRKGSKGQHVIFAGSFVKTFESDNGPEQRTIPVMRAYTVFNVDQIDGLPERFYEKRREISETDRNARADAFLKATGVQINHGGAGAYYSPGADSIQLPDPEAFESMGAYYATAAHELIHWTAKRCGRELGKQGTDAYAFEELIAEIGAAYLCADLGLETAVREDHAPYLATWLKRLQSDTRAIFRASTAAQAAVNYLQGLAGQSEALEALEAAA
jgi:antirestriction protein ArdC